MVQHAFVVLVVAHTFYYRVDGENHFSSLTTALYGLVLLMAAIAYFILQLRIIASQGENSLLKRAIGNDWKVKVSPVLYALAIPLSFCLQWSALCIYTVVALFWLVPDRRIERTVL